MAYAFQAKVASRGYHVFKNTSWENTTSGDKVKIQVEENKLSRSIDPYCCAVKVRDGSEQKRMITRMITVGHIPREIFRYVYYLCYVMLVCFVIINIYMFS